MPLLSKSRQRIALFLLYAISVGAVVTGFLGIRAIGVGITAPLLAGASAAGHATVKAPAAELLHILLALVTIVAAARFLGNCFRAIHQPPVIGEIIAGIALGPSLLGRFAPPVEAFLLPANVAPALN